MRSVVIAIALTSLFSFSALAAHAEVDPTQIVKNCVVKNADTGEKLPNARIQISFEPYGTTEGTLTFSFNLDVTIKSVWSGNFVETGLGENTVKVGSEYLASPVTSNIKIGDEADDVNTVIYAYLKVGKNLIDGMFRVGHLFSTMRFSCERVSSTLNP